MLEWFKGPMGNDLIRWLDRKDELVLSEMGLREDQVILDFGCGSGNYTIPAAKIVGSRGRIYALDKESRGSWPSEGLDELIRRIKSRGLENIVVMKTSGELRISLIDKFIDVILAYDVLHSWYFPSSEDRRTILGEFYRILKPDGFLSFYPGDPEIHENPFELNTIIMDIEFSKFQLINQYAVEVIHEDTIQRGTISNFKKLSVKKVITSRLTR